MVPRNSAVDGLADHPDASQIPTRSQDCLPFRPPGDLPRTAVPRYLFRVCSPRSAGRTTAMRAASVSAASSNALSRTDIFGLSDASLAADMVHQHLCWQPPRAADNLVSWTSSLLSALVYIFYRRANYPEDFCDIWLYIVDTRRFRADTFISDLDLIRAFQAHNADLDALARLHETHNFGEYLTQGSLGLEGRCAAATALQMLNAGLLELHPRFGRMAQWESKDVAWGGTVIELRKPFLDQPPMTAGSGGRPVFANDVQILSRIGDLFGVGWRAPVAVALLSLAPNRTGAGQLLSNFGERGRQWDPSTESCLDPTTTPVNPPEVAEFIYNLNEAYREFCEDTVQVHLDDALRALDAAQRCIQLAKGVQQLSRDCTTTRRRLNWLDRVQKIKDRAQNVVRW